jgi:hypothetical protein
MLKIIVGHLFGIILAFLISPNPPYPEESIAYILFGMIIMFGFLYYQLFNSINKEHIYWRGMIYKKYDPFSFHLTQFNYSTLAGFFLLSFIFTYT